jgi:hypothetical protein
MDLNKNILNCSGNVHEDWATEYIDNMIYNLSFREAIKQENNCMQIKS